MSRTPLLVAILATVLTAGCADDAVEATSGVQNNAETTTEASEAPATKAAPSLSSASGRWLSTDGTVIEIDGDKVTVASQGLAATGVAQPRSVDGKIMINATLDDGSEAHFAFDGEQMVDANGARLVRE